jgi:predicted Zn-dependent peptidase
MGPSELLPTLLWLDADRLQDLGRMMTQEKLDKQRAIVRNERRQSYENRPYGRADLVVTEVMFPRDHPYGHTVIGSHQDLEAATLDDVKEFFAKYYVPSNASLVVAGDFDPEKIRPLIAEWFGTLPRGSNVPRPAAKPAALEKTVRMTMSDNVQYARTEFVYHSPAYMTDSDATMDLVAGILTDGISSRLYDRLIARDELALDVTAFQDSMMLGSLFHVRATAREGVDLDQLEATMDEVIDEFLREGPTEQELEKQKAQREYAAVSGLQSLLRKADALNRYQFYFDEPNSFRRDLDRYRNASTDGVKRTAGEVLTRDRRLVLRVIPEIETPESSPLDRQPPVGSAENFEPPLPKTFQLENGVTVHHWERHELPMVAMTLMLPVGTATDPADRSGLTTLAMDMLDEGAGDLGAVEFADALELLGANVRDRAGKEMVSFSLSTLTRNFDESLSLFADAVRRPRFDEQEWERVHTLHVENLKRAADQPGVVARNVSMRAFFGDDHPYGRPNAGTPESAAAVTLRDARERYEQLFRPDEAVVLIAGDLSADDLKRKLNAALGDWRAPKASKPIASPTFPEAATDAFRIIVVDRPDAVQTVVQFVMPAPTYADPRRQRYELVGTILGGSFTSRLNQNLREDKGYTYGAGCRFSMNPDVGYLVASSRVRADVTGASVGEFLKEFRGIRGGDISAEEARKARSSSRMDMIQSFAGLQGILGTAATLVLNDRPFTDLGSELSAVAAITAKDLNAIAREAIPLETGVLVLVGDKKTILQQLEGLDLPEVVEFSAEGVPVVDAGSTR